MEVMSLEKVRRELLDGGLHEESVERMLDHYQSMKTRLSEGEYDEAGTHIGNFCENMVNILRDQMGESIQNRPDLGTFVDQCVSGAIGTSEPNSIRLQIPRTLRAAYDIRNNRDSVHVHLEVPVNHADTQAGIAMCSWMLAEILRVYGASDDTDDMTEVGELIEKISEPITDRNPLESLERTDGDFDRQGVFQAIDGVIQIVEDEVQPGGDFPTLDTENKVVSLMLGRLASADLGYLDELGASSSWFGNHAGVTSARIRQIAGDTAFIQNDDTIGGYHIPTYRVQEALESLEGN